jgi:hypothetical protein
MKAKDDYDLAGIALVPWLSIQPGRRTRLCSF